MGDRIASEENVRRVQTGRAEAELELAFRGGGPVDDDVERRRDLLTSEVEQEPLPVASRIESHAVRGSVLVKQEVNLADGEIAPLFIDVDGEIGRAHV